MGITAALELKLSTPAVPMVAGPRSDFGAVGVPLVSDIFIPAFDANVLAQLPLAPSDISESAVPSGVAWWIGHETAKKEETHVKEVFVGMSAGLKNGAVHLDAEAKELMVAFSELENRVLALKLSRDELDLNLGTALGSVIVKLRNRVAALKL